MEPSGDLILRIYGGSEASYRNGGSLYSAGSYGYYWSSSLYTDLPCSAWYVNFYSGEVYGFGDLRFVGFSVRPVTE